MRARHIRGDSRIRALFAEPLAFATGNEDLSFDATTLREIRARTLLVVGERDSPDPLDVSLDLRRGISDARVWLVPGAGHRPLFTETAGVRAQCAEFSGRG